MLFVGRRWINLICGDDNFIAKSQSHQLFVFPSVPGKETFDMGFSGEFLILPKNEDHLQKDLVAALPAGPDDALVHQCHAH